MSTSASRQMRSARNAMAEALGLGETYPLRDMPVTVEPPVATFGAVARVSIDDSEIGVVYRLLDQSGQPLPGGAKPEATGDGGTTGIDTPPVTDDIPFTVHAVRPNGRDALLIDGVTVKVGLNARLPVAAVSVAGVPAVIDYATTVTVEVGASQEGVTYRLVARPSPDPAKPDDGAAQAADIALSDAAGIGGTGDAIRITSLPLMDDVAVRVRVNKVFTGRNPRPPQTTLLTASLPVFVRADPGLAVAAEPQIADHATDAAISVTGPQKGVHYQIFARAVADAEFVRTEPPAVPVIEVATDDGPVRIAAPQFATHMRLPAAWAAVGEPQTGDGATLTLGLPARTADTLATVAALKTHGAGTDSFTSLQRLTQTAAVLVRPDPKPPLRLEAAITDGRLTALRALAGQPGVFYALAAAAPLGTLYLHQPDPGDATRNKGIAALAIGVDFVVSGFSGAAATSAAPPPAARLDGLALDLPLKLAVTARRATSRLTADLGTARLAALPKADAAPASVAPGKTVAVTLTDAPASENYALLINGTRAGDPVAGAAALTLTSPPLDAGAVVELWASGRDGGIVIERRTVLPVTVA